MIDWIKYFPLKFRQVEKNASPKGPSFSKAKIVKCTIGGNQLSFKAPRHRPITSTYKPESPKSRDLLDFPARNYNKEIMPNKHWQRIFFFRRYWAFYGPWFTGPQSQLSMGIKIINKNNHQSGVSFFHPRAFEDAVADYLTSFYGHDTIGSEIMWVAPINWKPTDILPVVNAKFDVMPTKAHLSSRQQLLLFPITDVHIVVVELEHRFEFYGSIEACKKKFDSKPMEALANDIINSFSLTLGSKTQAQLDSVKSDCPDMSLSNTFAPLKWPSEAGALDNSNHENIKLT